MTITASSHLHHNFEHTQPYPSSGCHSSIYCTSVFTLVSTGKDSNQWTVTFGCHQSCHPCSSTVFPASRARWTMHQSVLPCNFVPWGVQVGIQVSLFVHFYFSLANLMVCRFMAQDLHTLTTILEFPEPLLASGGYHATSLKSLALLCVHLWSPDTQWALVNKYTCLQSTTVWLMHHMRLIIHYILQIHQQPWPPGITPECTMQQIYMWHPNSDQSPYTPNYCKRVNPLSTCALQGHAEFEPLWYSDTM